MTGMWKTPFQYVHGLSLSWYALSITRSNLPVLRSLCQVLKSFTLEWMRIPASLADAMIMSRAASQSDQPCGTEISRSIFEPTLFWNIPELSSLYPACSSIALAAAALYVKPYCLTKLALIVLLQVGSKPLGLAFSTRFP